MRTKKYATAFAREVAAILEEGLGVIVAKIETAMRNNIAAEVTDILGAERGAVLPRPRNNKPTGPKRGSRAVAAKARQKLHRWLLDHGPTSQKDAADAMGVNVQTLWGMKQVLIKEGLVKQTKDKRLHGVVKEE